MAVQSFFRRDPSFTYHGVLLDLGPDFSLPREIFRVENLHLRSVLEPAPVSVSDTFFVASRERGDDSPCVSGWDFMSGDVTFQLTVGPAEHFRLDRVHILQSESLLFVVSAPDPGPSAVAVYDIARKRWRGVVHTEAYGGGYGAPQASPATDERGKMIAVEPGSQPAGEGVVVRVFGTSAGRKGQEVRSDLP